MAKRNSKTVAQQCRYYEVDNIFVYMVETYINGNFETFRRLYHELNKDTRRDFMDFLLSEVEPTYWRERLKQYNPQIEMFARFKMKSSFHKTKRII
ncbi:hypothetical protein E1J02_08380 [Phocaeicola dorei]|nr:hypothetical protein E1J05_14260 [Phocaeicola dorei]TDA91977.1 hypothetical protein E1J02_08380 [Phocaeicola dorei]